MRWLPSLVVLAACHSPGPVAPRAGLNFGTAHRPIRTHSAESQAAFDRGLISLYAFNYDESRVQFYLAWRADEDCAMCAWGYAMAGSPNINDLDKQWPGSRPAADRAVALARTPVEKALAQALVVRLAPKASEMGMPVMFDPRDKLNAAYREAMAVVAKQFPDDDDVQIAYVEALLIDTPRLTASWDKHGRPASPNIVEAKGVIERVLARSPHSIGGIHYYIHVTDQSPYAVLAAPYADQLGKLSPDAGHLVHMPSHTYIFLGRFADAEDANIAAIAADKRYLAHTPPGTMYEMFTMHPRDFLMFVLLWSGQHAKAKQLAAEMAADTEHAMPNPLGFTPSMIPFGVAARYGRWDDALALALPPADAPVTSITGHYARGLALAATGKLDDAVKEVEAIRTAAAPPPEPPAPPQPPAPDAHADHADHANHDDHAAQPMQPPGPPPYFQARVRQIIVADAENAAHQLEAAIAFARGDKDAAIAACEQAVAVEDALPSEGEMMSFPFPARQRLGAYLLAAGRATDAERVYREDLKGHAENGWSLFGLASALDAQHEPEAKAVWDRFAKAWARADVKLTASVF